MPEIDEKINFYRFIYWFVYGLKNELMLILIWYFWYHYLFVVWCYTSLITGRKNYTSI